MKIFSLFSMFFFACAGAQRTNDATAQAIITPPLEPLPEATELRLVKVDVNGDSKVDLWKYVNVNDRVLRREVDYNHDGKPDIRSVYRSNGTLKIEEMDIDFDGTFEWRDHYKGKKRIMTEIDTNLDQIVDIRLHYKNGKLVKKEQDTTLDSSKTFALIQEFTVSAEQGSSEQKGSETSKPKEAPTKDDNAGASQSTEQKPKKQKLPSQDKRE